MKAKMRGDKRKKPTFYNYRLLTFDECTKLKSYGHCHILDHSGNIAQVKITSVERWKTRTAIVIHCQFGLRDFFTIPLDNPYPKNVELIELGEVVVEP